MRRARSAHQAGAGATVFAPVGHRVTEVRPDLLIEQAGQRGDRPLEGRVRRNVAHLPAGDLDVPRVRL